MEQGPENEALWLRGLLPRRRNLVPEPPAWGEWDGGCWSTEHRGPLVVPDAMAAIRPHYCKYVCLHRRLGHQ
eukprot:3914577-Pyramimonas_sp.AAC.1